MSDINVIPSEGVFLAGYRNEKNALIADTYGWHDGKLKKLMFHAGKVRWEDVSDEQLHELKTNPDVTYTQR